jgi:uncharacterized protein (TIGR03435 family)
MTHSMAQKLALGRTLVPITTAVLVGTAFMFGLLDVPEVRGQSQATPKLEFEVASIKPHDPVVPAQGMRIDPDGITYSRVTLYECIKAAFSVYGYQISGADSFGEIVISDRYDVVAKAGHTTNKAEVMQMLQALLEERFKLKVHRETKEIPVYALVVGKNAPKLLASEGDGASNMARAIGGGLTFDRTSMPNLAEFLSGLDSIHRPVLDRTGIQGLFKFTLTPFDGQLADPSGAADKRALFTWPTIFTDIQSLGLKLESTKAPVEMLRIDHAEKAFRN